MRAAWRGLCRKQHVRCRVAAGPSQMRSTAASPAAGRRSASRRHARESEDSTSRHRSRAGDDCNGEHRKLLLQKLREVFVRADTPSDDTGQIRLLVEYLSDGTVLFKTIRMKIRSHQSFGLLEFRVQPR
jgi:hypothetical protein